MDEDLCGSDGGQNFVDLSNDDAVFPTTLQSPSLNATAQDSTEDLDAFSIENLVMQSLSNQKDSFLDCLDTVAHVPQPLQDAGGSHLSARVPSNSDFSHKDMKETPDDELTMRLTSRYGSLKITDNGQLRYYGVTSNLHMIGDGLASLFQPVVRSTRIDGDAAVTQAGLDWEQDLTFEQHLFDLYFAWHSPLLQETQADLFLQGREIYRAGGESSFYSPALVNAMYVHL
jgi:hypothetical protein